MNCMIFGQVFIHSLELRITSLQSPKRTERMRKASLSEERMRCEAVFILVMMILMTKAGCIVRNLGRKTCHPDDFKALKDFKAGIVYDDSLRLEMWNGGDCCKWEGISCDNSTGRVTDVNLPGAITIDNAPAETKMKGRLSPSLHLLTSLEVLDLSGLSELEGEIPPSIGHLENLRELYLFTNELSGRIPESIGNLSNLESMILNGNRFSGSVPSGIGNLSSLRILNLDSNQLSGQIPDSIENLNKLENLYLQNNFLTGSLPENIGDLQALEDLDLSNNILSGTIPDSTTKLKFITRMRLSNNLLTGSIPTSFGNLKSLDTLALDHNLLEGIIPSSFGDLDSLSELHLSWNSLRGKLPTTIGFLPLTTLSISHNLIEGPLPLQMSSLRKLQRLHLSFNPLNLSFIPTWVIDFPSLHSVRLAGCGIEGEFPEYMETASSRWVELDLSVNNLTGSIPKWLGSFNFGYLNLSVNSLVSKIPITFRNLADLNALDLHSNRLSGSLTSVFQMRSNSPGGQLDYVDLSNNSFSGDIEEIGTGTQLNLRHINMSHNYLKGKLPKSVGNLKLLSTLDLSQNHFKSVLPESLANAKGLRTLMLQNNHFRGEIPQEFLKLKNLKELNLSNNRLSGRIPSGEPLMNFPVSSYSGNKGLCGTPLCSCNSSA